jgi:hypothetical protein
VIASAEGVALVPFHFAAHPTIRISLCYLFGNRESGATRLRITDTQVGAFGNHPDAAAPRSRQFPDALRKLKWPSRSGRRQSRDQSSPFGCPVSILNNVVALK